VSTPDPAPQKSLTPNASSVGSGLGGSVAVIVIAILGAFHVVISPEVAAAIAAVCSFVVGYIPGAGRADK
jgi:hypothetical protein